MGDGHLDYDSIRLTAYFVGFMVLLIPYLIFKIVMGGTIDFVLSVYKFMFALVLVSTVIVRFSSKYTANLIGKLASVYFFRDFLISLSRINPVHTILSLAFSILLWFNGAFFFWVFAQASGFMYRILRHVVSLIKRERYISPE